MDIKQLYNDSKFPASFAGKKRFYQAYKSIKKDAKFNQVDNALKAVDSYTLHKPVKKPPLYRRIYTKGINYLYQIDLVDMSKFENENDGFRWLITIIDTFSKKAWAFKMKNKSAKSIMKVMVPFFQKNKPQKIEFDQGTEFYNRPFLNLLRNNKIIHFSVYSDRKCAIVERFNRTLKTRMYRSFTARGSHRWVDILQNLVNGYNKSKHRSTKFAPNDVSNENEDEVRKNLFPKIKKYKKYVTPIFKIGDSVRITRKKSIFQKGYEQTYSYEVFTICEIKDTYPVTYGIKDYKGEVIKGSWYASELQAVDISDNIWPVEKIIDKRKKGSVTEYFVKFLGYPEESNSWISQQDLFDL